MAKLSDFAHLREHARLEAKRAQGGLPKSIWETYSAFANTEGGIILLGVDEEPDGSLKPVGISHPERLERDFWNTVNNPNRASVNILTSHDVRIDTVEGPEEPVDILVITVPGAPRELRPVFVGGNPLTGTYRRNGEGDYRCSPESYQAMVRDASASPLDTLLLDEVTTDAISPDTLASYRNMLSSLRPNHPWNELPDEDFLIKLGAAGPSAGSAGLRLTRAGLLMFGYEHEIVREFPSFFLDYREIYEEGTARWTDRITSNSGDWSGNVFEFWFRVSNRLTADLRKPFELDNNQLRVDSTPMHDAVREGLVNALIHADYLGRRPVVVQKYRDRVEFSNPGDMRVPVDVALQGGISDARNPTLMKMFSLLAACERAGSGLDAIQTACRQAQAGQPIMHVSYDPDCTKLVVPLGTASAFADAAPASNPTVLKTPSGERQRVLRYIETHGPSKRVEIQEALEVGSTKAKRLLSAMVAEGLICTEGASNQKVYLLP